MRRMWCAAIALLAVALVGVAPAWAGGFRSPGRSGFVLKNTTGVLRNTTEGTPPVDPWASWGVPHGRVPRVPRNHNVFVPFVPFGGSTVVSTVVSSPTTIVYEGVADPAPVIPFVAAGAVVPPVPPVGPLVEYAEGWYQLQGDGISVPYRWVWIPRPPAPPAPAATAPASAPSSEPLAAGPRIGGAYQWTDEQGVTSWTNRPERIPQRFRDQAVPSAPDVAPR